MTINSPCGITSRLLPGVKVGDGEISIGYAANQTGERDGRTRYQWYVDCPAGEFTGDDLRSGCQGGDLQGGLESLLAFLCDSGDRWNSRQCGGWNDGDSLLFPDALCEWAHQHSDELGMLACELEEQRGAVVVE